MIKPIILRRRFIPDELVDISRDELLFRSGELLITRWKAIKQRADICAGVSYTFLHEGYKISRFYNNEGKFIYWYCDVIDFDYDRDKDTITLIDLLVDIKILPDGMPKVLDADELAEALEKGLISVEQACGALKKMDGLLKMIYKGDFPPPVCRHESYWTLG